MKRTAPVFLLCVVVAAGFSACTSTQPSSSSGSDGGGDLTSLTALYKDAVRVPITPQIVNQIRDDHKEHLFDEIQYYPSVNITLMRDRAGDSSLDLETHALRQAAGTRGNQEISVLTFREGGSSLDQSRISRDDEGRLIRINPAGDTFEIEYPDHQIVLGFVLNREEQWYDLEFAVEEAERVSLALTGARPHLMINYRTVFPDTDETRIQLMGRPKQETEDSGESAAPQSEGPYEHSNGTNQETETPGEAGVSGPGPFPPEDPASQPWDSETGDRAQGPDDWDLPDPAGEWDGALSWEDPEDSWHPGDALYSEDSGYSGDTWHPEDALYPEDTGADMALEGENGSSPLWETSLAPREQVFVEGEDAYEPEVLFVEAPGAAEDTKEGRISGMHYVVQVGAFQDKKNADAACAVLARGGFSPRRENYRGLTRVFVPAVEQKDLARTREEIKALGFDEPYVRP